MSIRKVIRNGQVAVLYSQGYGAGWSTWGHREDANNALFNPEVVEWVEGGKVGQVPTKTLPLDFYTSSARGLKIKWIPVGTIFQVKEYDGWESIEYMSELSWTTA